MKWFFQEYYFEWSLWGIGVARERKGGWAYDELCVFIGPLRLVYLGEPKGFLDD